jgi:hypothetical protein
VNRRLSGNLEKVENGTLSGWIWDEANPDQAIEIQIFCDDKPIRTIPANLLRGDLKKAGKGNGRHGYQFALPGKYLDGAEHRLVVKDTLEDAIVGRLTKVLMPRAQNEADQALAMDIIDDCPALMGDGFSGQVDAQLKDFVLSISGWVRDNNRPVWHANRLLRIRKGRTASACPMCSGSAIWGKGLCCGWRTQKTTLCWISGRRRRQSLA